VDVLYPYAGKYRLLLVAYKFGRRLDLGNFLAEKIARTLTAISVREGLDRRAALVPVPPRPGKVKKAGWDQVEYLSRRLEAQRGNMAAIPVLRCLERLPSKIQKELGREERLKNLQGRIRLSGKAPRIAIIIDDVMTTGATLDACASVLKQNGTEKVYGLCLFHD
jgi:ComF family protein